MSYDILKLEIPKDASPLTIAIISNRPSSVRTLIANGHDSKRKDSSGRSPEDYAKELGDLGMIALLAKPKFSPTLFSQTMNTQQTPQASEKPKDPSNVIRINFGRHKINTDV